MYADRDGRADARADRQTDRQTDMKNHQKPACENGKLRTCIQRVYCSIKDVSVGFRMVNVFSKILLSTSAIFADTIPYFKIMQFLSSLYR